MFNKLLRIILGIAIVCGILFLLYTYLPLNITGGIRQWIQEQMESESKDIADGARNALVPTVDPVTKRKVSSGVTYGQLMTKNCSDVSWYVRKNGEGWKVECNGYKVTIEVDDLVTPDNSKTWTDAHLRINYFVSKDKDVNYVLDSYKIKINDDDELDDTYAALVIDDLLSKAK